jgi:high affinity Mn2+ porin
MKLLLCALALAHTAFATERSVPAQPASGGEMYQNETDPTKDPPAERWNVYAQTTSIGQAHGAFPSPYEGWNSLPGHAEKRVSLTATIWATFHLLPHTDVVVSPELAGGRGFGSVTGIAGFTNGEIPRVAAATPAAYWARAYVVSTWGLGAAADAVSGAPGQVAGTRPVRRLTLIAGKFAMSDFFDANSYSHDPRTQFMNWSVMHNGAWDYPADTRGYTVGALAELAARRWSVRLARVMEPTTANGAEFDTRVARHNATAVEWERRTGSSPRPGAIRALAFLNHTGAGTYSESTALALGSGVPPDLANSRRIGARKYGFGLNVEQAVADGVGVFGRCGWNDGKTETWAFTEIDRSVSGGLAIAGRRWRRRDDRAGIAAASNHLSSQHARFLAAGGYGFLIGDGRLSYQPESVFEAYYAASIGGGFTLTLDYQRIGNRAYNSDRGPVSVATARLH